MILGPGCLEVPRCADNEQHCVCLAGCLYRPDWSLMLSLWQPAFCLWCQWPVAVSQAYSRLQYINAPFHPRRYLPFVMHHACQQLRDYSRHGRRLESAATRVLINAECCSWHARLFLCTANKLIHDPPVYTGLLAD